MRALPTTGETARGEPPRETTMKRRPNLVFVGMLVVATSSCDKKSVPASADKAGPGAAPTAAPAAAVEQALALLGQFEGEIDLTATNSEQKPPRTDAFALRVKSGKVRVDLPEKLRAGSPLGEGSYVIFDATAKKLEVVAAQQQQVFVVDLNTSGDQLKALGAARRGPKQDKQEAPKVTLNKTGKFDTVAGRKCENWEAIGDTRKSTICVAEEETRWFQIPLSSLPSEHAWAAELLDGKHFPLRFIAYGKDGATESQRVEVTKIDKKALPAADFEYPATYRVSDFGQMFAGLAGMQGGLHGAAGGYPGMPGGMPAGYPMPSGMPVPPPRHHP
jgi:Domain of unknown function (DUF4412)